MDEYDGNSLLKSYFYSYDESCALKTTEVTAAGQLFTLNKIKYTQTEGKNRYNEIQEVTDIKDNTTSYERDGNGNVTKVIYADGSYSLTRYNGKNMPVIQSDECGYITITRYDETGIKAVREYNKFLPVSDPQAFVNSYNENMALSENDYSVTEYTYASASETGGVKGFVKTIISADNVTVEYCYGVSGYAKGLPVTKYVKIDNTIIAKTEYEYNEQLQPSVERVYADISHNIASIKEFEYDAFSNLIEVRDYGTGTVPKVSITEYDLLSRKTADYSPLYAADRSHSTTYTYYPNGKSTGYDSGTVEYDLDNNVISSSDTIGNSSVYTYDLLGRVLTVDTTNAYDPSKNVSSSYEYDIMGRVKTAATNGVTTIYEYDKLGRKYSEREASANHSVFRGYFYEGVSPFLSREITGRYNLLMYSSKEYAYDDEMRLQTVKEGGTEIVSYSYDAVGNKLTETLGNGVVSNYSYNRLNKITNIETALDGDEISNYQYFYNLDGSDYCKIRTEGGIIEETSYGYDGLNRLISESVAVNDNVTDTYSYEYDDYGNRSRMTASGTENYFTVYDYNDAQGNYTSMLQRETKTIAPSTISSMPSVKETAYSYDANGNLISETSGSTTKTYTYNSINQLVGYTDGSTTAAYTYNTNGLRIEKVVNGQRINHAWDGSGQIVADINGNDIYNAKCYVCGTGLAAKYDFVSGSKTGYTYYLQNAHGDVDDLLDENGAVTKSYRYDAFGVEKNIDENDMNAFRYCGEYYDKETATIYLRARYYNPSNGRFNSRDSFAGRTGDPLSLNLYTYCKNNPVRFIDPSGHDTVEVAAFAAKNPRPTKVNSAWDAKILKQWDDKYNRLLNSPPSINSASDAAMYTSLRKEVTVLSKINSQSDVKAYATEIKEHNIWLALEAEKKAAADKRKAEAAARKAQARFDDRLAAVPAPSYKEYYETMDEAAIDFVLIYNESSISEKREYQTSINRIYVDGEEKYTFTDILVGEPRTGVSGEGKPLIIYEDTVAYVHTHAHYEGWKNNYFSTHSYYGITDISIAQKYSLVAYVGVPNGNILKFDPTVDRIPDVDPVYQQQNTGNVIFNLAPFDPNDPEWSVD